MKRLSLTIATRKSPLALWQANSIKNKLISHYPHLEVTLLGLTTTADRLPGPLPEGKGLFVKELEEALLNGTADIAVHSMKDMPVNLPKGLVLSVICERENPQDALLAKKPLTLATLKSGKIGTGSPRRACQLLFAYPNLTVAPLRGNVGTRLNKLFADEYDAIILAIAGLKRLDLMQSVQYIFPTDEMLPAAGQGAIGIECRMDDLATQTLIAPLNHLPSFHAVQAERSVCRALGVGCQTPVAVLGTPHKNLLTLRAHVGSLNGRTLLKATTEGDVTQPEIVGETLARILQKKGVNQLLF